MNRFLNVTTYIVKKLWLLCAIVLVLFAVLLSVLRYSLPYLDEEKQLIEDYLSAQYGIGLTIDSLSAAWQGTGPSIVLHGVEFLQNDLSPVELKVDQVYVEVDFWQSLQQRELSSKRFDLVGLEAKIDTQRIEKGGEGDFPIVEALRSLFLDQLQSFSLLNGEVTLVTPTDKQVIELSKLVWVNRDKRHQGRGEIRVQDLTNNSASFVLDLYGEKSSLTGVLYATGEELDISPWVSAWLPTRSPVEQSRGNFEMWSQIVDNQIDTIQFQFEESDIAWRITDEDNVLESKILGGSIQALPIESGWTLRVDQLILQAGNNTLVTDLVGRIDTSGNFTLNTVKPITLAPLMALTPLFTDVGTGKIVKQLNPEAELATLQVKWQDKQLSMAAKVFDMKWQQSGNIPGVNALDGEFYWHDDHGMFALEGDNVDLAINNLLPENMAVTSMKGRAYMFREASEQWVLQVDDLDIDSELIDLKQAIRYQFYDHMLASTLDVSRIALTEVNRLFPADYMGKGTVNYLKQAFSGNGEVKSARILWSGRPEHFPFAENQGIFQARVEVQDAEFTFAQDWPSLTGVDIELWFENESLTMRSPTASLEGIALENIHARIPRLNGSAVLTINALGNGTGEQVAQLMRNSGLRDSLGKILSDEVVVNGPVQSEINLEIPLTGKDVKASGVARLRGNSVNITSNNLTFNDVNGDVRFNNANINIEGLAASLYDQPVELELTGNQLSDSYLLAIQLNGNWLVEPLIARVNPAYEEYVTGRTPWQMDVSVSLNEQEYQFNATIKSDLVGITSRLPAPIYKDKNDTRELMVLVDGDNESADVNLTLGSDIRFNGVLSHDTQQFTRAHLALGASDMVGLGSGFSITAAVPEADVTEWYRAIELLVEGMSAPAGEQELNTRSSYLSLPDLIIVKTDNLVVAEQTLTDVTISARQQNNNWMLDVISSQAKADITIFDQWLEQGITINADFIRLVEWQSDETKEKVSHDYQPDDLPPIRFSCSSCIFKDKDFGSVNVEVSRIDRGMAIERIEANNGFGKLQAKGTWLIDENQASMTRLEGEIKSQDIGGMLTALGINSGIKDSKADIDFALNWNNSPFNVSPETLNGQVDTELTDGYLTQVSDKGSRIFTLFSLNSLVRKLSLDFRDVFAKGFFYDDIKGSLNIVDGVASTSDTVVDGGAGEIEIKGFTDLAQQTLNYNVSFTPNVTGNLPFLVYFMVNPPTALAALALDQVLTSAKVISNVNYHVTGTIDEPIVDEVGRNSEDIPLPAQRSPQENDPVDSETTLPDDNKPVDNPSKEPEDVDS